MHNFNKKGMNMKKKHLFIIAGVIGIILAVGVSVYFLMNQKEEIAGPKLTGLSQDEIRIEPFMKLFPNQYEGYLSSEAMANTEFSGSEPKSKFAADMEPLLPILFSGSAFSTQYLEDRGHVYALKDLDESLRVTDKSPGACLQCKSTAVPPLVSKYGEKFWTASLRQEIFPAGEEMHQGAVGCSTCHKPNTMELTVTRPGFIEKMTEIGIDLEHASQKDMKNYVCAQCHVEYYFRGDNGEVTHPWNSGFKAVEGFIYYSSRARQNGFEKDYVSNVSGAPMLKAQHPDYEMYSKSAHAKSGVTCADCHMPKMTKNGKKISSHQMTSPLHDMQGACGKCHKDLDKKKAQVSSIQGEFKTELLDVEAQLAKAHYYVNRMITTGCTPEEIKEAQTQIRFGQWFMDFNAAENSTGFHNPEGAKDNFRIAKNAIKECMSIAEPALIAKDVDLKLLDSQIEQTIANVLNEPDHTKKKLFVNNEWFPSQAPAK
ncbi:MAG: nitrite reductase [Bacillales bacterium]|jgi:nitrite reductase (cytochrome c-552)|nr:nitrite reductase [Bacillales bacterium]